jgi:hypothetical protein
LSNQRSWTAMDIQTQQPAFPCPLVAAASPSFHSFGEELRCRRCAKIPAGPLSFPKLREAGLARRDWADQSHPNSPPTRSVVAPTVIRCSSRRGLLGQKRQRNGGDCARAGALRLRSQLSPIADIVSKMLTAAMCQEES